MFDLGDSEILILAFLALLVLGPEEIPPLARRAGLFVGRVRRLWSRLRSEIDREVGLDALRDGPAPESRDTAGDGGTGASR